MNDLEAVVMKKVSRRLIPLLMLLYFVSYIDRINIGFAALTMNRDLHFTPQIFGLGAAFFFVGYLTFQIPGPLLLHRFGARRLTTIVTFLWGLFAVGMALVYDSTSFYAVRLLLGAAESAFFPAMIYYMSLWFPATHRRRVLTLLLVANPLAGVIGLPLSALLMRMDGLLGLTGWQWVFVIEGLPAVFLSYVAFKYLTDTPSVATWLKPDERAWLVAAMERDVAIRVESRAVYGFSKLSTAVIGVGYFGLVMGLYGLGLWVPQIVHNFGLTTMETGFLSAIPYVGAVAFLLYWSGRLARRGNNGWHAAIACLIGCAGLLVSAFAGSSYVALAALTVASMGLFAALPAFWSIPTALFAGSTAVSVASRPHCPSDRQ